MSLALRNGKAVAAPTSGEQAAGSQGNEARAREMPSLAAVAVGGDPPARRSRRRKPTFCEHKGHRRGALARARRCSSCRAPWKMLDGPHPCIGCKVEIDYYSCSPGYCKACAHDPCWVPLEEVWPHG